jgi:hypothetical protein
MRLIFSRWMVMISVILFPGLAMAQYGYVPECQETVANQLNISPLDVAAELGPFTPNRNRIVNWRARRGGDSNGYCEFNTATGELVRAVSGEYNGPAGNRRDFGRGAIRGGAGGFNRQPIVNFPRVSVDTAGRGDFNGPGNSIRINRGWVNTKDQQVTVALSGEHNFKINFNGRITQQTGDREFIMQIDSSDRGNATGTATFRFNSDRNEVEYISIDGRLNGQSMNGNFRR